MAELSKEDKKQLKKLGTALINANAQVKQGNKQAKLIKEQLIETMQDLKIKSFSVKGDETTDGKEQIKTIVMAEKMTITYDIPKLKEKLGKELFNEIAVKVVTISDLDAFIKIMREYEVPFGEVKDLLNIHEEVSNARVNQLYKTGDIDLKKIKKCYTADFTNYISVR